MPNIIVFRHSNRMDKSTDNDERNKWFNSKRFKQNVYDSPLSKLGIDNVKKMADNLINNTNIKRVKYIYSSPLTRCIETSIGIIDRVYKLTKHRLYLKIEYGLTSDHTYNEMPYYKNGKRFVSKFAPVVGGKTYNTKIDKCLYPNVMRVKYQKYFNNDEDMKSIVNYKDVNIDTDENNEKRYIKVIKKIIGYDDDAIIMTHCYVAFIYYLFFTEKIVDINTYINHFGGRNNTGVMVKYNAGSIKNKVHGKIKYASFVDK